MTIRQPIHRIAGVLGLSLSIAAAGAAAQRRVETSRLDARTILAVTYPPDTKVEIELDGTARLPEADGEAEIKRKRGATEIEIELDDLKPAHLFGGDYNTYVLWAASPDGQVDNLGELILRGDSSKLDVTTRLETFGLFVTAEPHYLVSSPSPFVVLENVRSDDDSRFRTAMIAYTGHEDDYHFEHASLKDIPEPDVKLHAHLEEARTAVALADRAGAAVHAASELQQARDALVRAEVRADLERESEALLAEAHEAVRLAVSAERSARRAMAEAEVAARDDELEEKEDRIRELESRAATARTDADRARLVAEQERLRAELAAERAAEAEIEARQAERRSREREVALAERERELDGMERRLRQLEAETEQARTDAERSRLMAEQEQLRARLEAERAREAEERASREMTGRLEAEQEAERLRAERERARADLQAALERILEVRETARGLMVNIPNVLFDLDRDTLRPEGRDKLRQLAGVLGLARGYRLVIEGHTDNTGTREYNLDLSRRRAESVRNYLVSQAIPGSIVEIEAHGQDRPIVSNRTAEGRQQNRRVEITVEELPEFMILLDPTEDR